jgi:hypothetical protein
VSGAKIHRSAWERYYGWLATVPEPQPDDPPWRPHFVEHGDAVRIIVNGKVISTELVIVGTSRAFKIEDGRLFDQRTKAPTFSGVRSKVRAWRVAE